jgi:glycosyltransferase involved in cell wall biosynthesis
LKQKNQTELVWHLHEIVESPAILKSFLSYLIKQADKIIAVSLATKKFWDTAMGNEKVDLLYNGLHLDKFNKVTSDKKSLLSASNDETCLVGMVGRVQHWKGQHYFLEIIEQYFKTHESDKHTKFILVGDPFPGYENLAVELVLDIKRRQLNDRVFYIGYRADIPTVLKSIDLLVLPSTSPDPLPTVVLEAMASSKAVLATAQGGALEMVVEHSTGRFMPINDAKKSATILSEMLSDKEALKKMGEAGRERVEKEFSATAFANNWNRLCS